jgi:ABC-2 type transport system ATP-binding protein
MSEMAITADRLIIIGRGRLLTDTTVEALLARSPGGFVRVRSPQSATLAALLEAQGATVERRADGVLHVTGATRDAVGHIATTGALTLQELADQRPSLEETYMNLTRHVVDYRATDGAPEATVG